MENYFIPLYLKRQRPITIQLEKLKKKCFVIWSAFFPFDQTGVDSGMLRLATYTYGLLAVVYLDFYKGMRLRLKIFSKIGLPLGTATQTHYDPEMLRSGVVVMHNTITGTGAQLSPYVNINISHAQPEEYRMVGLALDDSSEVIALDALCTFLDSRWNSTENLLNNLEPEYRDATEVLKLLAIGEQPKSLAAFMLKYGIRVIQ